MPLHPNTGKAAPSSSGSTREDTVHGNTTSPAGSLNPALGQGIREETLPSKMGITMSPNARIILDDGGHGGDHVQPNANDGTSTAQRGGDFVHSERQNHDDKAFKQRLERDDEREFRRALGLKTPVTADRHVADP
ncbi:hypothetical protein JCM5296_005336 [Sporobolomyces johnsonii]